MRINTLLIALLICQNFLLATDKPPEKREAEILQALMQRNVEFEWLKGKVQAQIESDGETISGTLHFRMKSDSAVLISVRKFGLEAARVFADTGSYTILYRLENTYESGAISDLTRKYQFDANLTDLQQLIAGNVMLPDTSSLEISSDGDYEVISSKIQGLKVSYYLEKTSLELKKMTAVDAQLRYTTLSFEEYREVSGFGRISFARTMEITAPEGTMRVKFQCEELQFNVSSDLSFTIPAQYEKIN
jgi:hypothetical protein